MLAQPSTSTRDLSSVKMSIAMASSQPAGVMEITSPPQRSRSDSPQKLKGSTMVETEAQKEFMRYAFLKEPKTPIGKLVAGAWRKFKEWWDMHKRKEVEEKTRESVIGKLAELKKETKEHPRTPVVPKKHRETELE